MFQAKSKSMHKTSVFDNFELAFYYVTAKLCPIIIAAVWTIFCEGLNLWRLNNYVAKGHGKGESM